MTTFNLPDLYARVVAKRPELAVMSIGAPGVRMYYDAECLGWYCELYRLDGRRYWDDPEPKHIGDRFAAALILARWVEAMPEMAWVGHCGKPHIGWRVCYRIPIGATAAETVAFSPVLQTPIEALAAFFMEYQP